MRSLLDLTVLALYFGAMAMMGPLFARRGKTTEGYFLGDRSFPGWLTGVSMFATSISSITFMAYPGDAFRVSWFRMLPNFTLPIGVFVASVIFIPFFRRGHITSAFEYLEGRFGPKTRVYAAAAFIVSQVVRISMILFLVSLLVKQVTGLNPYLSIVIGGIITSFYTVLGGIRAVLWTDFIQAAVLWIGGLLCLIVVACKLPGGLGQIISEGAADGKFQFAELTKEGALHPVPWFGPLSQKTIWVMLFLGLTNWLTEYSSNQNVIQRYAASKSPKEARRAIWICCWFSIPTWAFFMFLGTAFYVFFKQFPNDGATAILNGAEGTKASDILPFFVIKNLPPGLAGLVIAGVLAAAMSSISSSINGVSAVSIVDIYRRHLAPGRDDRHYVLVAKGIGVALAVLMIGGACVFMYADIETLQDASTQLAALMGGGLLSIYLMGFLTKRGDGRAIGAGIVCTLLFTVWMTLSNLGWLPGPIKAPIDNYYAGILGNVIMFVVAFGLASVLRRAERDLTNLTVWTQDGSPLE
ncbi:MAG: sodium:solute symporter [Candidatus Hydrogenedentes bacterium]|nr:sodium:solute symporter [Candidatus Hydrogenedentota bacterium]